MARTPLSVQSISRSGLNPTYSAAPADGHSVANGSGKKRFIHVKNGGGSPINVTVQTPLTIDTSLAVSDLVVAVPNAGERIIGPFPSEVYSQSDGSIYVDFSGVSSVTVAAFELP